MSKNTDYNKIYTGLQDDITAKLQGSLAILLSNYIDYSKEGYWSSKYLEPDQLKFIRDEIINSIVTLSEVVTEDEGNLKIKDDYFHKYIAHKETIGDIQKSLKRYLYKAKFYEHILKNYFYKSEIENFLESDINDNTIITECISFVEGSHSIEEEKFKMSSIMACLPIKMARIKYFEYIRKGIEMFRGEESGLCLGYVENIQDIFSSCLSINDIAFFPQIDENLKKFENLKWDELDINEINKLLEEVEEIIAEIVEITEYLLLIFESINSLLTIYTFVNDMDYLFQDNFAYKDAYYFIKESIENKHKEMEHFGENIVSILEEYLDKKMEEISQLMNKNKKYLEKLVTEEVPQNLNDIVNIHAAITHLFYEDINDIIAKSSDKKINDIENISLDEKIDEFIFFIEKNLKLQEPKIQRQFKQFFIGFLVMPLTVKEFVDYLEETMSSVTDMLQKKIIVINLYEMFEKFEHYTEDMKEYYDDECDCGHDHQHSHGKHDHDCDCGHEHQH